ncbi:MAG: protein kinase, partial [Acidobacteriota bacterium]
MSYTEGNMELSGLIEGRFKLLGPLGKDEIGATFLVEDQTSGKQAALRKLRTSIVFDDDLNEALLKGFESSTSLVHPHICSVREFLKQESVQSVLILMEYIPGETLRDFLFKQPHYRCDEATFLGLAEQIMSAMEYAHRSGITHRDMTPENVMITDKGSVKVIDFGIDAIVKEANFRRWNNPIFLSTYYVSPEQIVGEEPSPLMDIYSLGCLFYEMLAGKLPFNEKDIVNRQPDDRTEPIPGVSERLNALILQCLASDRSERPQSVEEMQSALTGHESPVIPQSKLVPTVAPNRAASFSAEAFLEDQVVETSAPIPPDPEDPVQEARSHAQAIRGESEETLLPESNEPTVAAEPVVPTEQTAVPPEPVEPTESVVPPLEVAPPEVVAKVFGDEEVSPEESVSDEEWVPDEDLPFASVEPKGSSRRVFVTGGVLLLIVASLWWYSSDQSVGGPPVGAAEERASVEDGVSGELAEVEVLQVDESEESVAVEGVLTDLPEEPLGSLPSTPDSVTPVALEESGIEDQNEPTGQVNSEEPSSRPREALN